MHKLRDEFFEEGKRLDAAGDPAANCWLCKQRIDYEAGQGTTPDSHTLDHFHVVDDRPDLQEDPSNFRHAHFNCNSSRGKRTPSPGLGEPAPSWW
ncbi:hypothetical protein [Microbacterium sp.]|uniref:hypothetical protein n=1 Tax=Microbacterium sp. TaxID=51671 RepID=UPI003F6E64B1